MIMARRQQCCILFMSYYWVLYGDVGKIKYSFSHAIMLYIYSSSLDFSWKLLVEAVEVQNGRFPSDLAHCKSDGSKIETSFIKIVLNTVVYDFCFCYPIIYLDGWCVFFSHWL